MAAKPEGLWQSLPVAHPVSQVFLSSLSANHCFVLYSPCRFFIPAHRSLTILSFSLSASGFALDISTGFLRIVDSQWQTFEELAATVSEHHVSQDAIRSYARCMSRHAQAHMRSHGDVDVRRPQRSSFISLILSLALTCSRKTFACGTPMAAMRGSFEIQWSSMCPFLCGACPALPLSLHILLSCGLQISCCP